MTFICVDFNTNLCEYAVLPLSTVLDRDLNGLKKEILGRRTRVLWGKKSLPVIIRGIGTKSRMEKLCDDLAKEAAGMDASTNCEAKYNSNSSSSENENTQDVVKRPRIDDTWNIGNVRFKKSTSKRSLEKDFENKTTCGTDSKEMDKLRGRIQTLKQVVRKYKARAIELKKMKNKLKEQRNFAVSENRVELMTDSGVYLSTIVVAAAKLTSKTPPILARRLFRQVFQTEDMKGRSLFGRKCNANKTRVSLPVVDEAKRDAVIEFALENFNLKPANTSGASKGFCMYSAQKKKIQDSLNKLLREVNEN